MSFTFTARWAIVPAIMLTLSGCLSLGREPPEALLNLSPAQQAAPGSEASGTVATALAILELAAPQKLNVTRIPVTTSASSLAYLKDAEWVEKPARLFARLLEDTIRTKRNRLLVSGTDLEFAAKSKLSGTLSAMDFDAARGAVVVRFDAILTDRNGDVETRRFESIRRGVPANAGAVGAALNQAANEVAGEVADWVG